MVVRRGGKPWFAALKVSSSAYVHGRRWGCVAPIEHTARVEGTGVDTRNKTRGVE